MCTRAKLSNLFIIYSLFLNNQAASRTHLSSCLLNHTQVRNLYPVLFIAVRCFQVKRLQTVQVCTCHAGTGQPGNALCLQTRICSFSLSLYISRSITLYRNNPGMHTDNAFFLLQRMPAPPQTRSMRRPTAAKRRRLHGSLSKQFRKMLQC